MTDEQLLELIIKYHGQGRTYSQVRDSLEYEHGHKLTRNAVLGRHQRYLRKKSGVKASRAYKDIVKDEEPKKEDPASIKPVKQVRSPYGRHGVRKEAVHISTSLVMQKVLRSQLFVLQEGQPHVSILELNSHTCRWPLENAHKATVYCGEHTLEGDVYCQLHSKISAPGGGSLVCDEPEAA